MTATDADIRAALDRIYDPCSVAARRPQGLVEMGLVLGWERRGTALAVRICLTQGDCLMAPHFIEAAKDSLAALPGIDAVSVVIDHDFQWLPSRMAARSTALDRGDIVPHALRTRPGTAT